MKKLIKPRQIQTEAGLVSIIVTIIITMILTLIVIGFARLTRRDERQSLDRQLNTQALYAAETGINDATELIDAAGGAVPAKTTCDNTGPYSTLNPTLDTGVSYTCLLVDPTPTTLIYPGISVYESVVVPIKATTPISTITIGWENPRQALPLVTCARSGSGDQIPSQVTWVCANAMLRIDLVPGTVIDRASLNNNQMTMFVIPTTGGAGTVTYDNLNSGARTEGNCSTQPPGGVTPICSLKIDGLGQTIYYMRIQSLYRQSNLTITAQAGGSDLPLSSAQAIVDVTGKAQDVLKRIQIRHSLFSHDANIPSNALETGSTLCKLLTVIPDTVNGTDDACGLP